MKRVLLIIIFLMLTVLLFSESHRQVTVVIDAIEDQYAVVLMGDESRRMLMPLELFPRDVREGTWYTVTICFEVGITTERTEQIAALIAGLSGN